MKDVIMAIYFHGKVHYKKRERMRQRRLLIITTALLLSFLAYFCITFVTIPPAAQARAYVIGSDPVDGSTLDKVPGEVRIFFNSPISKLSSAHIYSIQNGNLVDINAAPSIVSNTTELNTLLKTPDNQPKGSYEVLWTAVASNDGTTTYGIIGFDVGYSGTGTSGIATLGPTSSNALSSIQKLDITALLSIGWAWLTIMALTFWIGLLIIEQFILTEGRGSGLFPRVRKQTYPLEWLCLLILLCGEVISLILRIVQFATVIHEQAAQSLNIVVLLRLIPDTAYGWIWLIRLLLIVIAMIFLQRTQRGKNSQQEQEQEPITNFERLTTQELKANSPRKTRQLIETPVAEPAETAPAHHKWAWLLLAGLIALTFVFTSSVIPVLEPAISAFLFGWLYLIAQGIWLGGFAYLAFLLLPLLTGVELEYNTATLTFVLRRLTPLLIAGMSIQIVSGLFLGEASINKAQQLFTDPFGRALLVQGGITVITICLSLYALFVLRPKFTHQALLLPVVKADLPTRRTRQSKLSSTGRRLKLTTKALAICGAIIILCSAFQSFFAPPINFPNLTYANQPAAAGTNSINTQTQTMGDLTVTMQVLPNRVGYTHTVIVIINNSKGQLVSDAQVKLTAEMQIMNMGTSQATITSGNPIYIATFDKNAAFNMAGVWQIQLEIQRPGQQSQQKTFSVTLAA